MAAQQDGSPPERVEAGTVTLRRVCTADAGAIAAAVSASLDHLRPWMPWASLEAADRRTQLARVAEADQWWESDLGYTYSVLTADHETLVGEVSLRRSDSHSAEVGYWIAASQANRGYGTAASAAITEVAFSLPGVTRVEIHCDAANKASAAIARKAGYRLDRIESRQPEAPGESGRMMIWVRERGSRVPNWSAQAG